MGWLTQWLWSRMRHWQQASAFAVIFLGLAIPAFLAGSPDPSSGVCGWCCTRWFFLGCTIVAIIAAWALRVWERRQSGRDVFGRARFEGDRGVMEKGGLK
jgi:hypothetical protein